MSFSQQLSVTDDGFSLDRLHLQIGFGAVRSIGCGFFITWIFSVLLCNRETFLPLPLPLSQQFSISGQTLIVVVCLFLIAVCFVVLRKSSNHLMLLRSAMMMNVLLIIGVAVSFFIGRNYPILHCLIAGLSLGLLSASWHYLFSVTHVGSTTKIYKAVGEIVAFSGLILLGLACMEPSYRIVASSFLAMISIAFCSLLFYAVKQGSTALPRHSDQGKAIQYEKSLLPFKALAYVFAYSLLLAWTFGYISNSDAPFSILFFSGSIVVSGVVLFAIWLRDRIRWFFENTIRLFLPVTTVVAIVYGAFFPSPLCLTASIPAFAFAFLYVQSRIGYSIKMGNRELGVFNGSIFAALTTSTCGIFLGSLSYDLFFANTVENGPLIGAFIMDLIAIIVVAIGVGEGGYNLQNEHIREAESNQATEEDNRQYYKQACKSFAQRFGLTSRQEEVLFYLGRGRNARYIQERLGVSDHTAKSHIYSIYKKAGTHSQQDLMAILDQLYLEEKNR